MSHGPHYIPGTEPLYGLVEGAWGEEGGGIDIDALGVGILGAQLLVLIHVCIRTYVVIEQFSVSHPLLAIKGHTQT